MQRTKEKLLAYSPVFLLLCFSFGWLWFNRDVYFDPNTVLPRDNQKHHLPMFIYQSDYVRLFGDFPNWLYSREGGVWLSALTNNFLVLMPHRLVAVWLNLRTDVHPNLLYKLSLLLGQFFFCWGLYVLSGFLFGSRWVRAGFTFLSLTTAVTLTFTYQEHALGTLFYVPWLWASCFQFKKSPWYWVLFFSLLGLSFNNHYPQLLMVYALLLLIGFILFGSERKRILKSAWNSFAQRRVWVGVVSVLAFLISASPVIYSYAKHRNNLESPFRLQKGEIVSSTYADYQIINTALSKLHPQNLKLYFNFRTGERWFQTALDESLTYMGPTTLFVLFWLFFLPIPLKKFHIFMVLGLSLLSLGTHTFLPRILWYTVPGISLFRQWIFFLTFLDLHLLFLTFVVSEAFLVCPFETVREKGVLVGAFFLFLCAAWFKWVEPEYAIPGCLVMMTKVLKLGKLIPRAFLYTWLVVGTIAGASFYLDNLRIYLNDWKATRFYTTGLKENDGERFARLKDTYIEFVALPKGVSKALRDLSQRGEFFYSKSDGPLLNLSNDRIRLIPGGFKIALEPTWSQLIFSQLNEGGWEIESFNGRAVPKTPVLGEPLRVQLLEGTNEIHLIRSNSLWDSLIYWMWLPILTCAMALVGASLRGGLKIKVNELRRVPVT